jgi:hypothetical protein
MAYQYKVVEVREKMIGGKVSGDRVEKLLNEWAAQGWQLKDHHVGRRQGPRRPGRGRRAPDHLRAPGLTRTQIDQ